MTYALNLPVGNDSTREYLLAALHSERLAHSILFCGEKGCGAGFLARCLAADFLYFGQADTAQAKSVLSQTNPEVLTVRGSGASGEIKIEDVRRVRRQIYDTPLSAKGRVVILYDVQNLNQSSANALLKVIEEPPKDVLFLLTASSTAVVLPTIRSRCCVYQIAPVSLQQCIDFTARQVQNHQMCTLVSRAMGGKIGSVLRILQKEQDQKMFEHAKQAAQAIEQKEEYVILTVFSHYEKERQETLQMLSYLASICSASWQMQQQNQNTKNRTMNAVEKIYRAMELLQEKGNIKLTLTCLGADLMQEE